MAWIWLRGLGRESAHWGGLPRKVELLTGEKVIAIDLPGMGRKRAQPCPLTMNAVVQQLQDETLELDTIKVLAVSLGAMVALNWAAQDTRIKQLVLINSSSRLSVFTKRLKWIPVLSMFSTFMFKASAEERERKVLAMVSNNARAANSVMPLWAEVARRRPVSLMQILRQMILGALSSLPKPNQIANCSLQVFASSKDRLVSADYSRKLADYYRCSLVTHPEAGHDLSLDDPDWLLGQLQVSAFDNAISSLRVIGSAR